MLAPLTARRDLDAETPVIWPAWCYSGENGGGNVGRRYACEPAAAAAPAPTATSTPAPAPATPAIPPPNVKYERLSPHESNASRSRSVTPSTPSYPGTPPERGSPHAPGQPGPSHLPRNCSDIMRSLAARYNPVPTNNYFHRVNGFSTETRPSTSVKTEPCEPLMGGLFSNLAKQQGGPPRLPAFPPVLDMNSTKTMLAISRLGRSRRKRVSHASTGEYSPLDLSAASCENAAKRARLSESPSTRSDNDDRDRGSNGDRSETHNECLCAEARARLQAWSVDEVCDFVNSIDICAEYSSAFREQRIDGGSLPLLTEQHLTKMLQMKLGPALKLRAVVAARLEPCAHCQSLAPPVPSTSAASPTSPVPTKINGTSLKTERNTSPS